ncbi:putative fungal specific transcription protein [Ophiocordyceps camponoti-floridani]|uniref:Putative fungal specific transcription protein n=1 Tax=Ophiocordyceps camponoti-floridani TaxID=2030778 RepID=A0A8H4Q3T3_9HYPO|nr:putative fungal specific transcription protein [Ophiocordyceps camponoti-floridani]
MMTLLSSPHLPCFRTLIRPCWKSLTQIPGPNLKTIADRVFKLRAPVRRVERSYSSEKRNENNPPVTSSSAMTPASPIRAASHSAETPPPSPPPTTGDEEASAAGTSTAPASSTAPAALPAPCYDQTATPLPVGGEVKLDHLGPLVVNEDGTMSRIANWIEMTDVEKENTVRILGKRNKLRLAALGRTPADHGRPSDS